MLLDVPHTVCPQLLVPGTHPEQLSGSFIAPLAEDVDQTDTWFPKWAGCCYIRNMVSLQAQYRPLHPLREKLSHMFLFGSGMRLTTLQVKPVVQLHGT